jgi:hypothetical protein
VLSTGGLLLTDSLHAVTGFPELFFPGEACEVYGCQEELISKIIYYRSHPEAALRIARRGLDHFLEKLTPEQSLSKFRSALFGSGDLAALCPADQRCFSPPWVNLSARLKAYEDIQELHRQQLFVKVLVDENANWFRSDDFIDLPRVHLYSSYKTIIGQAVTAIDSAVAEKATWDYIIT